jgi:hypothetical protein
MAEPDPQASDVGKGANDPGANAGGAPPPQVKMTPWSLGASLVAIAILSIGFTVFLFFNKPIDNANTARGLITVIVSFGTLSIAIILLLAVLLIQDNERAKQRFADGKEILTILVGILGTIVGYYFGVAQDEVTPTAPKIASAMVSDEQPKVNSTVRITILTDGGVAPFDYEIEFLGADDKLETISGVSRNQWIVENVTLALDKPAKIGVKVTVTDKNGSADIFEKGDWLDVKTTEDAPHSILDQ